METYLIYVGKAALATGAFYIVYLALFQNRKQFLFNRIYLPVSLALSFVIPLITFTTVKYIEAPTTEVNSFAYLSQTSVVTETYSESPELWPHYLFGFYLLGITGFLLHLLAGHFNALRMVQKSRVKNLFGSRVHITKKDVHPFSFFNKIVLSENTLQSPNLEMIVAHENIHVIEKHTLDILFTEILFLLQWFNPFAWLIKDAVKNNLEYKTDDKIVKNNNPQTYQLAMVALADKKGVAPFLTALNGSQLKNRIIMMKKKTENKFALLKQLVLLPLLAVLVMGLSNKEIRTEVIFSTSKSEMNNSEIIVKGKVIDQNGDPISGASIVIIGKTIGTISDTSGNYEIKLENENEALTFSKIGYLKRNVRVKGREKIDVLLFDDSGAKEEVKVAGNEPKTEAKISPKITDDSDISFKTDLRKPPLYIVNGVETDNIEIINPEDIERIDVLKDKSATAFYGEKGKNGVVLIKSKTENKSGLSPATDQIKVKGKIISQHDRRPIPGATILFTVNNTRSATVSNLTGDFSIQAEDSNVFFEFLCEGYLKKEFAWDGSKELLVEMKPDKNSTIPGKTAEKIKWERMLRKAGIEKYPEGKEPIVIQDGYETLHNANDISSLYNLSIIKSIRYKKNTNIDIRRKELAKNGFIEIKTTLPKQDKKLYIIDGKEVFLKNQKPSVYIYPKQLQEMKELSKDEAVKKYGSKAKHGAFEITTKSNVRISEKGVSSANNPLIVVDGVITGYKSVDDINPADIQSVNILNEKTATPLYGDKGKNGVIVITSKQKAETNTITSELELRKFLAKNFKYPVEAQKNNIQGTVDIWAVVEQDGKITYFYDKRPAVNIVPIDEIVVVGYSIEKKEKGKETAKVEETPTETGNSDSSALFSLLKEEVKRVAKMSPIIEMSELKGKTVRLRVEFMLQ